MIDLPLLSPRLRDVIDAALRGDQPVLDEAVHHLVPEFSANAGVASRAPNKSNR
jgi:hypothetical protein